MSHQNPSANLLVFTNPVEGQEAEFNLWYDEVHLAEVLGVPGIAAARRWVVKDLGIAAAPTGDHKYLATYELEGAPMAAVEALVQAAPSMNMSSALANDSMMVLYELIPGAEATTPAHSPRGDASNE